MLRVTACWSGGVQERGGSGSGGLASGLDVRSTHRPSPGPLSPHAWRCYSVHDGNRPLTGRAEPVTAPRGPSGPRAVGVLGRPGEAAPRVPMAARGRQSLGSRANPWAWEPRTGTHRKSLLGRSRPSGAAGPTDAWGPATSVGGRVLGRGRGVPRLGGAPAGAGRCSPVPCACCLWSVPVWGELPGSVWSSPRPAPAQSARPLPPCSQTLTEHLLCASKRSVPSAWLRGVRPRVHRPWLALLRPSRLGRRVV